MIEFFILKFIKIEFYIYFTNFNLNYIKFNYYNEI
jgi:hypothetical protein